MNQLQFWNNWSPTDKKILVAISFVCIAALALLWISYLQSPAPTIATEQYQQLETQEIAIHSFSFAGIKLTTSGDNYLLFEHQKGGLLTPSKIAAYLFVGFLAIAMIVLLSIITTLNRFWYFVGMGLFILFIVGFRLETTFLFNLSNKIPTVVVLAIFGGVSYYFHSFNRAVKFPLILLAFFSLTFVFFLTLFLFSKTKDPFMHLAANGMIAGAILSIAFIFTVAHEILAFFVTVISQGIKQTKSLRHFSIISAIYMINLGLTYADIKGFIKWDFLSINLFLLLTISALLGLWGFRKRERLYANILQANPLGCYLFISLGVICLATIGFFLATANDPPLQLLKDTIMYSHLGYGIIFVCYVFANFATQLANNQQVHKVLYNPGVMPYFTFRLAGLIATYAFFAYSTYSISVHQLYAGYYDANGDVYSVEGDVQSAVSYYNQSLLYTNRNHHAHYALASFDAQQYELRKEKKQYELAADTRPTEQSYLNLSLAHERDKEDLQANLVLLKGLQDFPTSGKLKNALGLSYAKINLKDSAIITLEQAKKSYSAKSLAETNLVGMLAKFKVNYPADSLKELVALSEKGAKTNALALANQQGVVLEIELPSLKDSVLTVYEATLLTNYILNRVEKADTSVLSSIVSLARRPVNKYYKASLLDAVAHSYYAQGEVRKAFNLLNENAFFERSGKMYNTLGLWALEQGNAEVALAEFKFALEQNFEAAKFGKALALSELGLEAEAKEAWQQLDESKDTTFQVIANSFVNIYQVEQTNIGRLNDLQKYQYSHFRIATLDTGKFTRLVNTINDSDLKATAILDRSKKLWEVDEPQASANMLALLQDIEIRDKALYNEIVYFNLTLLAASQDTQGLRQQMQKLPFDGNEKPNKIYYDALLALSSGNKEDAKKSYGWLAQNNPFNEDATLAGIKIVKTAATNKLKAFNLLVDATSINPGSVKLIKAYIVEAANLGFDNYAQESLDKLKELISPSSFTLFIRENPKIFEVIPN